MRSQAARGLAARWQRIRATVLVPDVTGLTLPVPGTRAAVTGRITLEVPGAG